MIPLYSEQGRYYRKNLMVKFLNLTGRMTDIYIGSVNKMQLIFCSSFEIINGSGSGYFVHENREIDLRTEWSVEINIKEQGANG